MACSEGGFRRDQQMMLRFSAPQIRCSIIHRAAGGGRRGVFLRMPNSSRSSSDPELDCRACARSSGPSGSLASAGGPTFGWPTRRRPASLVRCGTSAVVSPRAKPLPRRGFARNVRGIVNGHVDDHGRIHIDWPASRPRSQAGRAWRLLNCMPRIGARSRHRTRGSVNTTNYYRSGKAIFFAPVQISHPVGNRRTLPPGCRRTSPRRRGRSGAVLVVALQLTPSAVYLFHQMPSDTTTPGFTVSPTTAFARKRPRSLKTRHRLAVGDAAGRGVGRVHLDRRLAGRLAQRRRR